MNKEEILKKSREANTDEGVEYAANTGRRLGFKAMCVIYIALTVFNLFTDQSNDALFATFWMYIGFEAYGKYCFNHRRSSLVCSVCGIVAGVLYAITHIIETLA